MGERNCGFAMNDTSHRIGQLLQAIQAIPGDKILTLMTTEQPEPLVLSVTSNGVFGRDQAHYALFRIRLASAFAHAGSLIIRQLSPLKIQRMTSSGRKCWIPRKHIYGIGIAHGTWMPLSKEEMRRVHCTDLRTGKPIPAERNVSFRDFPKLR